MGINNLNQFNPNIQGMPLYNINQASQMAPQFMPPNMYAPVIYNVPTQSMYMPAPKLQTNFTEQMPPQGQISGQPLQGPQEQPNANASQLLKNYLLANGEQIEENTQVQAINNISRNSNSAWKNNLKEQLRNSEAQILAVVPRIMNAKDTDGNGLIQGNEVRGTFMNAIERLDEIKKLGINTLHVLPVHPAGKTKAMGIAGSIYAPEDFLKVDPNLRDPNYPGTVEEQFKIFIDECHKRGISVMLDLPSCASLDFANKHPEMMLFEKNGNYKTPGGWQDIRMFKVFEDEGKRKLNPHLIELHKQYVDMCIDLGIDGIRADVARAKPAEFWDVIISYSRTKDPNFGWFAETYTYEDASPQINMQYDRPAELMKAGFDTYYGQYHIFDQWTKASDLRNYLNEQIDMQKEYADGQPRPVAGTHFTHDDETAMEKGGSPWVQFTAINQSMLPLCNPYFVDGIQTGDYYLYPYENAIAPNSETDTNRCTVHRGRLDIFNPSRKPGGNNPEIARQITNMLNIRKDKKYKDIITKGSMCWLKPKNDKDEIIAFARQYGNKTLLVIGNRDVNERSCATFELKDIKAGQVLKDLTLPYGDKSYFQTENGILNVDLGPSRMHVFEIDAPNIESDSFDISKFNQNGIYTRMTNVKQ